MTGSDAVSVDGHADVPSETSVLIAAMETDASTVRSLFLVYRQDQLEVLWLSSPELRLHTWTIRSPSLMLPFFSAMLSGLTCVMKMQDARFKADDWEDTCGGHVCFLPLRRKFPDGPRRLSCSRQSDPASPAGWTCRAPPPGRT